MINIDKELEEIKSLGLDLQKIQKEKLNYEKDNVLNIINNKIEDEREILLTFDNLLDLAYWYGEEIKEIYYKLLDYYKNINIVASNDYKKYYLQIIEENN